MAGTSIDLTGSSAYWGNSVGTSTDLPGTGATTGQVILVRDTKVLYHWTGSAWESFVDGPADVSGPASSTANAVVRYSGTSGKIVKNTGITVDDSNNLESVARLNATTAKIGGTGAAASGAILEVSSTTGGLLMPRMTTTQRDNISSPTDGIVIYNSTLNLFQGRANGAWVNLHGWGS